LYDNDVHKLVERRSAKLKENKITIRIEQPMKTAISNALHAGKFENQSQLVRTALKEFLKTE
jgi:Arc/MetJ-type ribon-helix-helix transcriptional regulator